MCTCNSIWLLKFVTYTLSGVGSHNLFPRVVRLEEDLALEVEYHSEQRDHKCTAIGTIVMCNNDKKVQKTQMFLPKWPEPLHLCDVISEVIATNHYQILLECSKGRKNRLFHGLFQAVIKTSHRIFINTTGKSALKLGNLPSLKVIHVQSERVA